MRTEPDPNQTTIKYRSTPESRTARRETTTTGRNQRARELAVPFRFIRPDKRDFRKVPGLPSEGEKATFRKHGAGFDVESQVLANIALGVA
jgi:hypothetical protein